jgi:hypothetical protein
MRRRDFITLLGGAAAWPLAARAQQPAKLPTICFLGQSTLSAASEWVAAFVRRLRELGWIENRTVAIDYRWAEGRDEQFGRTCSLPKPVANDPLQTWAVYFCSDVPCQAGRAFSGVLPHDLCWKLSWL